MAIAGSIEPLPICRGADGMAWWHDTTSPPMAPHRHAELELNLVLRGRARYLVGGASLELQRSDLVWLFPAHAHVLVERSRDFQMWIVVFRSALLRRTLSPRGTDSALRRTDPGAEFPLVARLGDESPLADVCKRAAMHAAAGHLPRLNAAIAYALTTAWDEFQAARTQRSNGAAVHPAVQAAALILRDDPASDDLQRLARRVHLSPSRLSHVFREQTGVTLVAYRSRCRLERVRLLMRDDPARKLLPTALEAGFGSYTQFHRAFVDATAVSPGKFFGRRSTPICATSSVAGSD